MIFPLGEGRVFQTLADVVVMIADRNREDFFRLPLANDETVEVIGNFPGTMGKLTNLPEAFLPVFGLSGWPSLLRGTVRDPGRGSGHDSSLAEELVELALEILQGVLVIFIHRITIDRS